MSTKMKLLTMYLVMGMIWCILGLPNLLSTASNKTWKATLIAFSRIGGWPILVGLTIKKYLSRDKESIDE